MLPSAPAKGRPDHANGDPTAPAVSRCCSSSATPLLAQDGASVYRAACASCHDAGIDRAPDRAALMTMTPERVLASLESGSMISMTAARTATGAPRCCGIRDREIVSDGRW